MKVGILAIQGAFAEHEYCLKQATKRQLSKNGTSHDYVNLDIVDVRKPADMAGLDGLIIPGGESTTMSIHLAKQNFKEVISDWMKGRNGRRPFVWGTCAGLILLANNVEETKAGGQTVLGGLDITACRNSFGRQRESFEIEVDLAKDELKDASDSGSYHGVFIRAPGVVAVNSKHVQVLATIDINGETRPVAVQQESLMATSFHPELTEDFIWHAYFLQQVTKHLELNFDTSTNGIQK